VRDAAPSSTYITCNTHGDANFRACKGPIELSGDKEGVTIPASVARALKVTVGDAIRFVVMQAPGASPPSRSVVP
jgi:arginine/ornithine N-succinyltransferase beta subunit